MLSTRSNRTARTRRRGNGDARLSVGLDTHDHAAPAASTRQRRGSGYPQKSETVRRRTDLPTLVVAEGVLEHRSQELGYRDRSNHDHAGHHGRDCDVPRPRCRQAEPPIRAAQTAPRRKVRFSTVFEARTALVRRRPLGVTAPLPPHRRDVTVFHDSERGAAGASAACRRCHDVLPRQHRRLRRAARPEMDASATP